MVDAHTSASVGVTSPEATGDESHFLRQLLKVHVRPYNVNSNLHVSAFTVLGKTTYSTSLMLNVNVMLTPKGLHKVHMDINVYFMQDF